MIKITPKAQTPKATATAGDLAMPDQDQQKCGLVLLIGATNAGKSTLINSLIGEKVSIVTHKVQTTRNLMQGIINIGDSQIILQDTPGFFKSKYKNRYINMSDIWRDLPDCDGVLVVIDAANYDQTLKQQLLRALKANYSALTQHQPKAFLVLNKVDKCEKPELLLLAQALNSEFNFAETFMISALHDAGTDKLVDALIELLPAAPWLYHPDQVSNIATEQFAAELTREKIMLRLHQELPYNLHVKPGKWQVKGDGSVLIEQTVYVAKPGHKQIILGKGGEVIKAIGINARRELSKLLAKKVHLLLQVKVMKNKDVQDK